MMAKPIKTLELHYPMIQFLIIRYIQWTIFQHYMRGFFYYHNKEYLKAAIFVTSFSGSHGLFTSFVWPSTSLYHKWLQSWRDLQVHGTYIVIKLHVTFPTLSESTKWHGSFYYLIKWKTLTMKTTAMVIMMNQVITVKPVLCGPHIKRTPAWVPKFSTHIYSKINLHSADTSVKRTRTAILSHFVAQNLQ